MSFKKFGGLNYSAKNNIVGNLYSSSTNSGTANIIGLENSKITSQSHLDMSANSVMHIGSLYFMDGTIQSTAYANSSGTKSTFNNGIIVNNGSILNGGATINGDMNAGSINASGTITAATFNGNLGGGSFGSLVYQSSANNTDFLPIGTPGQFLTVNSGNQPSWTDSSLFLGDGTLYLSSANAYMTINTTGGDFTAKKKNNTTTSFTLNATDANIPSYVVARNANGNFSAGLITADLNGKALNLSGITQYSIPYQREVGTTDYIPIGASGKILAVNSSVNGYEWVSAIVPGDGTLYLSSANAYITINTEGGDFTSNKTTNTTTSITLNATSENKNSTVVARNANGNFSAGLITADLNGKALNLSGITQYSIPYQREVGTTDYIPIGASGKILAVNSGVNGYEWVSVAVPGDGTLYLSSTNTYITINTEGGDFTSNKTTNTTTSFSLNATSENKNSTVVARNANGNFSAGLITASLRGNASTATSLAGSTGANQIPYQTEKRVTSFTASGTAGQVLAVDENIPRWTTVGTSGQVLTSNGKSLPIWTTPNASTINTANNNTSTLLYPVMVLKNDVNQIPYVDTDLNNFSFDASNNVLNVSNIGSKTTVTNINNGLYISNNSNVTSYGPYIYSEESAYLHIGNIKNTTTSVNIRGSGNVFVGDTNTDFNATLNVQNGGVFIQGNLKVNGGNIFGPVGGELTIGGEASGFGVDIVSLGNSTKNPLIRVLTDTESFSTESGALVVAGGIGIGGSCYAVNFISSSDYRIKDHVKNLDDEVNVDKLRPVTYINKNTQKQDIGFIAHEVQEDFPYLVSGEKDGEQMQSLNYIGLIGVLVKEIQELKKRVSILENK